MFIVKIPECSFIQDPHRVRQIEEQVGRQPTANSFSQQLEELPHIVNMLQRVSTAHQVWSRVEMLSTKQFTMDSQISFELGRQSTRHKTGIDANTAALSLVAQQRQELTLSAADFQDGFSAQLVGLDQFLNESSRANALKVGENPCVSSYRSE